MLTFHILNVYVDKTQPHKFKFTFKVSLQKGGIAFGFDAAVEDAIISKETGCTIDGFVGEVVDVYQK